MVGGREGREEMSVDTTDVVEWKERNVRAGRKELLSHHQGACLSNWVLE